jgi:hypothetical protein
MFGRVAGVGCTWLADTTPLAMTHATISAAIRAVTPASGTSTH